MNRDKSAALFAKSKTLFPGGVSSPVRAFNAVDGPPLFIDKGNGCNIWDADGNKYIDFCCSWGPLILGHNHPQVRDRVIDAVNHGTSFGTPTKNESRLGEMIIENHRYLEKIRFVNSGTEAVMSAVRLARGYTGRNKILKFEGCYHGHVDSLMVKSGSGLATFGVSTSLGIPDSFINETIVLPLDDVELLKETMDREGHDVACIIIEPIPANNGLLLQCPGFLETLRSSCDKHGSLLIFDEVISGFRIGFEGASNHYNIRPDLITFGKIIGGGFPVGAYGGREDIMSIIAPDGGVYQAGTLSGNPVSMAAGIAQLKVCLQDGFYEQLHAKTASFVSSLNDHCAARGYEVKVFNIGSVFWIAFTKLEQVRKASDIDPASMDLFRRFYSFLLESGVYIGPSGYEVGFVSDAHTREDLQQASKVICQALDNVFV